VTDRADVGSEARTTATVTTAVEVEPATRPTAVTARAASDPPDARLLRRVRWRLVAWSAATTLVVLAVLGVAFYGVVARALEQGSVDTLYARANGLTHGRLDLLRDGPGLPLGPALGGPGSGTFAVVVLPGGQILGMGNAGDALPVQAGVDVANGGHDDILTTDASGAPLRVLSVPLPLRDGTTGVLQIAQIITPEQQTLQTLLIVLVAGGALGLVAAVLGGAAYASRALVPIRDSLRRQREFAADASHELRTPLTVVRSNMEYLERHPEARVGELGEVVTDVREEVDRMTRLVEDLLLLARTDSGAVEIEPAQMDLARAADEAVTSLAPIAASRGVSLAPDLVSAPMVGDVGRLRQLVRILVDNAIKHSPPGGLVRLAVRPRPGGALLVVEDDGPGIASDDLPHVFERFWRAPTAPSGGTGLGLAIAEWIVNRHRGTISPSNRQPHGARFEVQLPSGRS
jgi:two-component system sensor histidine kinase CiaH